MALMTALAQAQNDIKVVVERQSGGSTTYLRPASTDWTIANSLAIPLGSVDELITVRIYDASLDDTPAVLDQSIGLVAFQGSWSGSGEVRVLVTGPQDAWPRPTDPLFYAGVVNLGFLDANNVVHGGFDFRDANGQPNPDLQKHTRLAAFTYDDIYGDITVGQIQRIQAGYRPPGGIPNPGTIYGHLKALTLDGAFDNPINLVASVGLIFAGNGVAGVIEAAGDPIAFNASDFATYASISGVIIGVPDHPLTGPQRLGVTGDVLAPYGSIGVIYSNGPIGAPQRNSIIRAGNGIFEVRALGAEANGALPAFGAHVDGDKAADFHVDLDAASVHVETGDPLLDGVLGRVTTFGSIYGTIHAGNIACPTIGASRLPVRPGQPGCVQAGILAGAGIYAPVTVDFTVMEGVIVARTIRSAVHVGWHLCGAIVSWDVGDSDPSNRIPSIKVGRAEDAPTAPTSPYRRRFTPEGRITGYVGGFGGGGSSSVPDVRDDAVFLATQTQDRPWSSQDWVCEVYSSWGVEDGTPALIVARSVGQMSIKRMSCWEFADEGRIGTDDPPQDQLDVLEGTMAQVQVRHVDTLEVDYVQDGAVWSGVFGSALSHYPVSPGPDTNDVPVDDYTENVTTRLGCVGPNGHLFLSATRSLDVTGSMAGEVFMPELPLDSLFRVGGRFIDQIGGLQVCSNADAGLPDQATSPSNYPGLPRYLNTVSSPRFDLDEPPVNLGSLKGQLMLNVGGAATSTPGLWGGQVIAMPTPGGSTPVPAVLATDRTAPEEHAPLYTHFSGTHDLMMRDHCTDPEWFPTPPWLDACKMPSLGGGAVGLVPFALDEADCDPRHDWLWNRELPNKLEHWPVDANHPLLNWGFGLGYQQVTIRFYGPVRTDAPANMVYHAQPAVVWYFVDYGQGGQWRSDFTKYTTITMKRESESGLSREVVITGNATQSFPPGYYAVQFQTAPRDVGNGQPHFPIYCDGLFDTELRVPPAANSLDGQLLYYFYLWPDCDHDAVVDPTESSCGGTFCAADLDDGTGTGTRDGGVDVNDLLYFLAMYEAGDTAVDLDDGSGTGYPDGGVDVSDLLFFLTHYEGGC